MTQVWPSLCGEGGFLCSDNISKNSQTALNLIPTEVKISQLQKKEQPTIDSSHK